jgi:hypothetical protein
MGGGGDDQGRRITADASGKVYLTGRFNGSADFNPGGSGGSITAANNNIDAFVAMYDTAANFRWVKRMGGLSGDEGLGLAAGPNGSLFVTGYFGGTADFNPGGTGGSHTTAGDLDVFVVRCDTNGTFHWARRMGGPGSDQGYGIAVDANRNVYVAGNFNSTAYFDPGRTGGMLTSSGSVDAYLVKLSHPNCNTSSTVTASACGSYILNGQTYTSSGTYTQNFTNALGCDSIVTLNVTINQASVNPPVTGNYCDSVQFNGTTYRSSGTYTQSFTNALGCDSTITYEVIITHATDTVLVAQACDSFAYNGVTYTASGSYNHSFTNMHGCDSLVVLDLTINVLPYKATTQKSGTNLLANSADSYQWINCSDQNPIPGATKQTYTVTENGSYAVIITIKGCSDTSDCVTITVDDRSIMDLGNGNRVRLYPNPTHEQIMIQTEQALHHADLRLMNMIGQVLVEKTKQNGTSFNLDIKSYPAGNYLLEIKEAGATVSIRITKE